jgi:hypothetical protein
MEVKFVIFGGRMSAVRACSGTGFPISSQIDGERNMDHEAEYE